MKIKQGLLQFVSPNVPGEARLDAAQRKGTAFEALPPEDLVTVLFVLSFDRDADVAKAALASFDAISAAEAIDALDKKLDPLILKKLSLVHRDNEAVLMMVALNPGADEDIIKTLAASSPEDVLEVLAGERKDFFKNPAVMEALKKNPCATKSLLESITAPVTAPEPLAAQKTAVKPAETVSDEVAAQAGGDQYNIYKMAAAMSMGQKVKAALTGNKSAREYFVKDANRLISSAVLKNPRVTEDEVLKITASKNTTDDMLRQIARHKEWVKEYNIKLGLVMNPKTPPAISMKLLDGLYEKDLTAVAKSKGVPSVITSAARRKLDAKRKP